MNRALKALFSMQFAVILFLIFAISCAVATFIENDFGVETSWAVVYDAAWFEAVQVLLGINLLANIFRFKIYKKEKLPSFIFHVGFLLILLGSGLTRYVGFEGLMQIREGKIENKIMSGDPYVQAYAYVGDKTYSVKKRKLISKISDNSFDMSLDVEGKKADIRFKRFIQGATQKIVDDPKGEPIVSLVTTDGEMAKGVILQDKNIHDSGRAIFSLNKQINNFKPVVNLYLKEGKAYFKPSQNMEWYKMSDHSSGKLKRSQEYKLEKDIYYMINGMSFALKSMSPKGKIKVVSSNDLSDNAGSGSKPDAIVCDVSFDGEKKEIIMYGRGKGSRGLPVAEKIGGVDFKFIWGSYPIEIPFAIKLKDFQLERYPGSMSPSSYASEVVLIDKEKGIEKDFKIFMNHVLDHRGFRFFQSSYDQDEKGTILSVNNDPGKLPTYLGYILLGVGFFLIFLSPKSRFRKLAHLIQKDIDRKKAGSLTASLAFLIFSVFMTPHTANAEDIQPLKDFIKKYDKKHAANFGKLIVQGYDGRMKPLDTLSSEILSKTSKKRSFFGLDSNQIILGMMSSPQLWQKLPIIKIKHSKIKKIIGINENQGYAAFSDFFDYSKQNPYKLGKYSEEANRKRPIERNRFDKDILKADESLNVSYMVYSGEVFKIFPKKNDPGKKWFSPKNAISTFDKEDSENIKSMLLSYFGGVEKGVKSGDWFEADKGIEKIRSYQYEYGQDVIQEDSRIDAEIFSNKVDIFPRLVPFYLLSGFTLLIFIFIQMAKPKTSLKLLTRIVLAIVAISFLVHTFGMGLRWYVADHAPWSNSYESMLYISWSIALAGIVFAKRSIISLSLTAILAGISLFVAHLSWMDPQITNLVPVLKSFWLSIHVSVITASYGFLGLSSILGFFTLILFIMSGSDKNDTKNKQIQRNIIESTRINEMSMILGLCLLTLGNFLGGVWANESWGRYWGWDPKETWSLVSILVYVAVVHLRFIPKFNNQYSFAVASTISYASIIMTYFGVNFYLSGMHSYAAGDPVPIPSFVYYTIFIVFAVIVFAFPNRKISSKL